jgi:CubicO group peptidase (beta-lactamase class C family)
MEAASRHTGLDVHRLERIGDHLQRQYIDTGRIAGCQIAVARHGHTAYLRGFGQRDLERGRPMSEDALFRIYSMTKPITSVALMTLYERGFFQLNDPVSRFFPAWRNHQVWVSGDGADMTTEAPHRPVSMRDMLCHTGGLTYGAALVFLGAPEPVHPVEKAYVAAGVRQGRGETLMGFMDSLAKVPLRYQPGERWMYSVSTDVCGALVEKISGMPFSAYLKKTIFDPLGMRDTAFQVPARDTDRFCANYRRGPDKRLVLVDDPATSAYLAAPTFESGGGGLVSNTADYMRFCEMLRRGGELDGERILGPRTIDLMRRNHLKDGQDLAEMAFAGFSETASQGVGFGLGFATTLDEVKTGGLGEGDYYWGGAASTIFWVDPREDLTVTFMTQLIPSATFNFRGQLKNLVYSAIVD